MENQPLKENQPLEETPQLNIDEAKTCEASEECPKTNKKISIDHVLNICVIGAGVVGLSTALHILQEVRLAKVCVVADKFLDETLSYGAGGFFRPEVNIGPDRETIRRWAKDSYDHYSRLAIEDPVNSGNSFVSGYQLTSGGLEKTRNELVESIVPPKRILSRKELQLFGENFANGIFWTTIITDPRYYLPYLQKKIIELGGVIEKKHVENIKEPLWQKNCNIVINCTGMGAAHPNLGDDFRLTPVRGQTIKVKAPWIRHFYFADGAYILPGRDYVTLGGIKDYGNSNMELSELDRDSIWSRCLKVVPSLKDAEVASEWVGLRPQRQPVRVEIDQEVLFKVKNGYSIDKKWVLVHNYGHGGHGITLAWGTAVEVLKQIRKTVASPYL